MEYPLITLCKVDEGRVGENRNCYEHQQQTKLLQVGQYQKLEMLRVQRTLNHPIFHRPGDGLPSKYQLVRSTRYLYAGDNDRLIKLKQGKASYEKHCSGHSLNVETRKNMRGDVSIGLPPFWWNSSILLAWYACCKVKISD